ncbi:hypothetical protein NF552_22605 (plasmid) [Roseomonas mucosa]|nr:hypothetical protein NF552_22605 [Roseomonas mucosa]
MTVAAMVVVGLWAGPSQAQQSGRLPNPRVTGHIQGYECMQLRDGFQDANWDQLPRVLAEPRTGSAEVGIATISVIVKSPHVLRNGYLEVLHLDGRPGWLEAKVLEPWVNNNAPGVRCVPAMMADNTPGFDYIRPRR